MTPREKQRAETFNRVIQLNNLIVNGITVKVLVIDTEWAKVDRFSYVPGNDFFQAELQVEGRDTSFSYGVGHQHLFRIEVGECVFEDCIACEGEPNR